MTTLHHKLQRALLHRVWRLVAARPGVILLVSFLVALLSAGHAFLHLRMNGNQDHLVSPEVPFQKTYLEHLENFGDQEFLYIVIETGSTETGRARAILFAERLAEELQRFPEGIQAVHYRISMEELGDGVLFHAPLEFVKAIAGLIERNAPLINELQEHGTLETALRLAGGLLRESGAVASTGNPGGLTPLIEVLHSLAEQIHLASRGESSSEPLFSLPPHPMPKITSSLPVENSWS